MAQLLCNKSIKLSELVLGQKTKPFLVQKHIKNMCQSVISVVHCLMSIVQAIPGLLCPVLDTAVEKRIEHTGKNGHQEGLKDFLITSG